MSNINEPNGLVGLASPQTQTQSVDYSNQYNPEQSAQYNSQALVQAQEPLYKLKAQYLAQSAQAKQQAIQGNIPQLPSSDMSLNPMDYPDINTSNGGLIAHDSNLRLLGSATTNLLGSTADLFVDAGAHIARGANNAWQAMGGDEFYSEDDKNLAIDATDFLGSTEANDKLWGYDRTAYQNIQNQVNKDVSDGNYFDAFKGGLSISTELLTESIPTIASYFVGVGEVNKVASVGKAAYKTALAEGLGKAAAKDAAKLAKKNATDKLGMGEALVNSARVNAGFLNQVNLDTSDHVKELIKNGGEVDTLDIARIWATNFILDGLDKGVTKDILGLSKTKALKQVWGKLDKPGKLSTAKAVSKAILTTVKNTGLEGAQEYLQQWGQVVNENWGAKDTKQLMQVLQDPNLSDEALTAFFLGAGPGALMGAPHATGKAGLEIHSNNKLRKQYEAMTNNVDIGFANKEDKRTVNIKLQDNYDKAKDSFNTLADIEQHVANIKKDNSLNSFEKIHNIQTTLNNTAEVSGATDNHSNNLIRDFGSAEVNKLVKTIQNSEELQEEFSANLDSILDPYSPVNSLQNIGMFLSSNSDKLPDTLAKQYNTSLSTLQVHAEDLVNSEASNVTFNSAKATLNRTGDLNKAALDKLAKNGEPKTAKKTINNDIRNLDSKPDWAINRLLGIGKPSEVEKELRKYDDATLEQVYRKAGVVINNAKRKQETILSGPTTSKLAKAQVRMTKSPEHKRAEQLRSIVETLRKQRKSVKDKFVSPKTWKETLNDFVQNKFDDLKKAADKVKADREARKSNNTNTSSESTQHKNRATTEDKAILKQANKMFNSIKNDPGKVAINDIPKVKEAINILVKSGNLGETKAASVLEALEERLNKSEDTIDTPSVVDTQIKPVRKRLTKLGKELTTDDSKLNKEEIKATLNKIGKTINDKLTEPEREFIASILGKAVSIGNITQTEATKLLNKLPEGMKFTKDDFTKDNFKSTIKSIYTKAVNGAKESSTKEGRTNIEKSIGNKISKATNSDLGKELNKDFTSIMSKMVNAAKQGKKQLTKQYTEFTEKYKDVTSLDVYQKVKETFSDLVDGKVVEEVDSIPGIENKC